MEEVRAVRRHVVQRIAAVVAGTCLVLAAHATADPPTPEQIQRQQQEADRLRAEAERQQGRVVAEQSVLLQLTDAANAALEAYDQAVMAYEQAQRELREARDGLLKAQEELELAQARLGRWAASTYRVGSAEGGTLAKLSAFASEGSAAMSEREAQLAAVGTNRSELSAAAADAQRRRAEAEYAARAAEQRSRDMADAAEAAKKRAEQARDRQRAVLEAAAAAQRATQNAAAAAQAEANRLIVAKAVADELQRNALASGMTMTQIVGPVGTCSGGNLSGYGNGQLPVSALCPLWGAPGHFLRADAAEGFRKLSQAYAQRFGRPVPVTDSYRDYAAQVSVRARKGNMAAVPGTSNHGWGRAVDFGGGISSFGTAEHEWMRLNAPQYGWYHPAWARQNGSKPEPWHWEFVGTLNASR